MARHADQKLQVLVVWEPILPTDWRPPSGSTLARIPDVRARQFWDPKHLVAQALSQAAMQNPHQPQPDCCTQKGFYWDDAILYAPRLRWEEVPAFAFWNGPVYRIIPGLEKSFTEQTNVLVSP